MGQKRTRADETENHEILGVESAPVQRGEPQ